MTTGTRLPDEALLALLDEAPVGFLVLRGGRLAHVNARAAQWITCRCAGVGPSPAPADGMCRVACAQLSDAAALCERSGSSVIVIDAALGDPRPRLEVTLRSARVGAEVLVVGSVRELPADPTAEDEARLGWRAHNDALTNLPNRATLLERLGALLDGRGSKEPGPARGSSFALLMVDLDGFKAVNDTGGHEAGDRVLTVTAQRFLDAVRGTDTVARIGGDEFVVLAPGVESLEGAERIAAALVDALKDPILIGERSFGLGCSVGIALSPADAQTTEALLLCADAAMYAAKRSGRNRFMAHGDPAVAEFVGARPAASAPRWAPQASMGVSRLDEHHAALLKQLARISKLVRDGRAGVGPLQQARRLLVDLVRDTESHFADEEQALQLDRLPNGEAHRRAHVALLANLRRVADDFHAQIASVVPLFDAFVDHIKTMDRASAACLWPTLEAAARDERQSDSSS